MHIYITLCKDRGKMWFSVGCGIPEDVPFSTKLWLGEVVIYTCLDGYGVFGGRSNRRRVRCGADRNWTTLPTCVGKNKG